MSDNTTPPAREFVFSALDRVISGQSLLQALPRQLDSLDCQRVMLVSSASLAAASDDFAELAQVLGPRLVARFDRVRAHTPRQDVLAALQLARDSRADLLLAIGGGSVIDACKVVQLALDQDLHSAEQLLQYAQRADGSRGPRAGNYSLLKVPSRIRQLAVPTTLSGAEFSNTAGVLDTASAAKEGYRGLDLCPRVIVYDPALARHTPQWLWLSTAIRSLDHAVEGYCSADCSPYHEGHFLHAMRLFAASLPACHRNPEDLAARDLNQQAVWLACCDLGQVAFGASHGIGYTLGSYCAVPHGYTSCVMLPAVLAYNAVEFGQRQQAIVDAIEPGAESAAIAVRNLVSSLELPVCLEDVGVGAAQLDEIAARAIRHPVVRKNPRSLENATQVREILELAWR